MSVDSSRVRPNFTEYIIPRIQNFTGREWVFKKIHDWFSDPNRSRYFLLTGEPGSGKTAIAGQLYQHRLSQQAISKNLIANFPNAAHFCSASRSTWVDPKNFSESIALQLSQIPEYAEVLLNIGEKEVNIRVEQNLGTVKDSTIQGVVINNLDVSGLRSAQEAFNQVVLDPLNTIYGNGFDKSITILVDSLDEALTFEGEKTIVDLLSAVQDLPKQVRFLLTSRPKIEALEPLQEHGLVYSLTMGEGLQHSRKDVNQYVWKVLKQQPRLTAQLAPDLPQGSFVTTVSAKSDGNFLHVTYLLKMLTQGHLEITKTTLEQLPNGLDGIYREFLYRLVGKDKKTWRRQYAPILGTLAIAQEALTREQLAGFTQMSRSEVAGVLEELQQFLDVDESLPASQRTYAIYHRSLANFLQDEDLAGSYWCDAHEHHEAIINFYKNDVESWDDVNWIDVDNYGLYYLGKHLYWQIEIVSNRNEHPTRINQYQQNLYSFICNPLMSVKLARFGSYQPFSEDIKLVIKVSHQTRNLIQEVRGNLILATLTSLSNRITPEIIGHWARLGEVVKAWGYASLMTDVINWSNAALSICESLVEQEKKEEAREVLAKILIKVKDINNENQKAIFIKKIAQLSSQIQYQEGISNILATVKESGTGSYVFKEVIPEVVQAQILLHDSQGVIKSLEIVKTMEYKDYVVIALIGKLAQILVQEKHKDYLPQLLGITKVIIQSRAKGEAIGEIAKALAKEKDAEGLIKVLETTRELDSTDQITPLSHILPALAGLGQANLAIEAARASNVSNIQNEVLARIVVTLALTSDIERAVLEARNIEYGADKLTALAEIAQAAIKTERLDQVNLILAELEKVQYNFLNKAKALGKISQTSAQVGNIGIATYCANLALLLVKENIRFGNSVEYAAAEALREIIPALIQLENKAEVNQLLEIAEAMHQQSDKGIVICELAIAFSYFKDEKGMKHLLTLIKAMSPTPKHSTLCRLAKALAQINEFAQAMEVAQHIWWKWDQKEVLIEIAQAAIQAKEYNQALITVRAISSTYADSEEVLLKVIEAIAQAGEFDWALSEAEKIEHKHYKGRAMYLVSELLARAGEKDRAKDTITQAAQRLELFEFDEEDLKCLKIETFISFTQALAKVGDIDRAKSLANKTLEEIRMLQSEQYVAYTVSELSQAFAQIGDVPGINKTLSVIETVENRITRSKALAKIYNALAYADEQAFYKKIKSESWFTLYRKYSSVGLTSEAEESMRITLEGVIQSLSLILEDRKLKLTNTIFSTEQNLIQIIKNINLNLLLEFIKDLKKGSSLAILEPVVKAINSFENKLTIVHLLCKLTLGMARGGQTHKARNIFKQAFAALESIKGSLYEPEALCNLSQALALVGQTNKATNLVNLALTVVEALEHKGWQSLYLSKISQTLVQLGEKDRITEIAIKVLESVQDKDWNNYFQVGVLTEVGWRKEAMIRAAISLAFVGKTDILNKSLILAEEIEDEECKTDLLTGIAIGFAQNINPQLDSIFKAIKLLKQEWHTEEILSQINEVLVQGRKKEELNQLFAVTQGIKSGRVKVKMFAKVAKALACIEDYETALLALKNALIPEYLVDRQEVFSLLKEGASVIAFIDRGQTLWKLYESITEVEEWWKPKDL